MCTREFTKKYNSRRWPEFDGLYPIPKVIKCEEEARQRKRGLKSHAEGVNYEK